ncbi:Protein spt10 [Recurvomyces mirabilis]|uniref:Protein spt10 n=2 Tax=Recurvomyces mirabilis TaxID=574656 RepID=A0AAE1C445_9PEZI|nr:Protein spt10 [Recurvomyces mirabilis]
MSGFGKRSRRRIQRFEKYRGIYRNAIPTTTRNRGINSAPQPKEARFHHGTTTITMPAMLDDPTAPAIYRVSGEPPFPVPYGDNPPDISLRQVTLRDRVTIATLVPFSSPQQVPHKLTAYLCELLNKEIEKGDTYPMMEPMPLSSFGAYWFANFGAVMVLGDIQDVAEIMQMEQQSADWAKQCLGSFYVKPNYPGRSSHVCNGGFLVTDAARNRGVGRLMGEGYLEWAPKLGYTYSVFNLVYETNVASLRIWDALGFKRIGRVKGCGNLKSYPDQLIDAIIFGRELGGEGDEYVSEERFDKIRFYLKTGSYPTGSDRAEKSRLRSAATHYRLIPSESGREEDDVLMLKGKEVVSDPHRQYEIARNIHNASHGGINKTTAIIAEKYHWVRIKETVSTAIRNCSECKDVTPKPAQTLPASLRKKQGDTTPPTTRGRKSAAAVVAGEDETMDGLEREQDEKLPDAGAGAAQSLDDQAMQHDVPVASMQYQSPPPQQDYGDLPVDPQIMESMEDWQKRLTMAENAMLLDSGTGDVQAGSLADEVQKANRSHGGYQVAPGYGGGGEARMRAELEAQIMNEVGTQQGSIGTVARAGTSGKVRGRGGR